MSSKKSDRSSDVQSAPPVPERKLSEAELEAKSESLLEAIALLRRMAPDVVNLYEADIKTGIAEVVAAVGSNDPTVVLLESTLRAAQEREFPTPTPVRSPEEEKAIKENARRRRLQKLHSELVTDLIRQSTIAGIEWEDVLQRTDLPKASRSRVNSGEAGLPTIARVKQALETMIAERDAGTTPRSSDSPPPPQEAAGRWVVVEGKQGLFFGRADATDSEIAERGHVRLRDCRSIRSEASPSTLASIGPRDPHQQVGLPAPSALILGVLNIYDCTTNAVKAFMLQT